MRNNKYWRDGYVAYDEGLTLEDCPYKDNDVNHTLWRLGWKAGQEDLTP